MEAALAQLIIIQYLRNTARREFQKKLSFTRYNADCCNIQCDKGRIKLHYCAIIRRLDNKQILTLRKLTFSVIRYVA